MIDLSQFDVLTFDCYGTLIDWETGILKAVKPCLSAHDISMGDEQILETYAEIEASLEAGPYHPYRKILHQVMMRMCERFGFTPNSDEFTALADSLPTWPPFADTVEALKQLKSKYRLGIISNVDDDLFAGSAEQLEVEFDYVITASQVGAYKPSPGVFTYALEKIGSPKEKILHVAQSLYHDHAPAKGMGFTTAWVNRRGLKPGQGATPEAAAQPDVEFPDLSSLARACGAAS